MPDTRKHRGPHPEDPQLFAPVQVATLSLAVEDLSHLLSRAYPVGAALKLVGDRYRLNERQRKAVGRAACSDLQRDHRTRTRMEPQELQGQALAIDGFNLIITLEAALSGAVLLRCRDGSLRDLSGIHGSYRSVEETEPALRLLGELLFTLAPASVRWLLDSPISNSGRLAGRIRDLAATENWCWTVETVFNPDRELIAAGEVVASSDSAVLDGAGRWIDLADSVIVRKIPDVWIISVDGKNPGEPEDQ